MRHISLDIETAGSRPGSAVLSIAAVDFWPQTPENPIAKRFFRVIDLWDSLMVGLTVDQDTLNWWMQQDKRARDRAQTDRGRVSVFEALQDFEAYLGGTASKDTRIWAKGPDFDVVMMAEVYRKTGRRIPWSYRRVRDVRTIMALTGGQVKEDKANRIEHDALDDALMQAEAVVKAYSLLGLSLENDGYKEDDQKTS